MSFVFIMSALAAFGLGFYYEDQKLHGIGGILIVLGLLSGSPWLLIKVLLFVATIMAPIGLLNGWRN